MSNELEVSVTRAPLGPRSSCDRTLVVLISMVMEYLAAGDRAVEAPVMPCWMADVLTN